MDTTLRQRTPDIKRYLRSGGSVCPFCGSEYIEQLNNIVPDDSGSAACGCICVSCHESWVDIYKLTGVMYEWTEYYLEDNHGD